MTGYANTQQVTRVGTLSMELRSVNSRFLDLSFRMADELRMLEPVIRTKLLSALGRGKVECRIYWERTEHEKSIPNVNVECVRQLALLEASLRHALPGIRGFGIHELLNWPGVMENTKLSHEELQNTVSTLCDQAIVDLQQNRKREGTELANILLEKIKGMESIVSQLHPLLPQFLAHYETRIRERMVEAFQRIISESACNLTIETIEERIRHEVALHGVRIDVKEELERLQTHFTEVRHILEKGGRIGKRLDFITQELNRETNTLGSKAHALAQTQASIDLKVLIEQFREQVQNIE